jgi:C-terminal processing protease CtpA/Prc
MKQLFLLLIIGILSPTIYAQQYTSQQAVADLVHLQKYLRKYHPSYDRFRSKVEIDSAFATAMGHLDSPTVTHRELAYQVVQATRAIGCGHTRVAFGKQIDNIQNPTVLPLDVWIDDRDLFIRNYNGADSLLRAGDRIQSIQGISSDSLITLITSKVFSDGYNSTHNVKRAEKYFSIYYHHIFGQVDSFDITAVREGETIHGRVAGVAESKIDQTWREYAVDSISMLLSGGGMSLHTVTGVDQTMMIKITSFGSGSQASTRKKIFKFLRKHNTQHLIIDLRGNGGGHMFRGNKFKAYFLKQWITGLTYGRKPSFIMLNRKVDARLSARLTALSFMLNPLQYPSKHGWTHLFPFFKKRNSFHGKLYVLTDGNTFSMASDVASSLKHRCGATVIGEESGGGASGSAGMLDVKIVLPHSKIEVTFNIYWAPVQTGKPNQGRGVMPDYPTARSLKDRMDQRDVDIEKAIELIKR